MVYDVSVKFCWIVALIIILCKSKWSLLIKEEISLRRNSSETIQMLEIFLIWRINVVFSPSYICLCTSLFQQTMSFFEKTTEFGDCCWFVSDAHAQSTYCSRNSSESLLGTINQGTLAHLVNVHSIPSLFFFYQQVSFYLIYMIWTSVDNCDILSISKQHIIDVAKSTYPSRILDARLILFN